MAEFAWTDELAIEYSHYYHDAFQDMVGNMGKDILKEFKASKQPKKDWEIVSLIGEGGQVYDKKGDFANEFYCDGVLGSYESFIKHRGCKIHSVRRLSDGCVFTVGDTVTLNNVTWAIERIFQHYKERNGLAFSDDLVLRDIPNPTDLKKVKHPLFTTEDGVEIYEGDKTFWVNTSYESYWTVMNFIAHKESVIGSATVCFSTEAAAKEYVKMNKPNLSVRDVLQTLKSIFEKTGEYLPSHGTISLELQAVSKSKI